MSNHNFKYLIIAAIALLLIGCDQIDKESILWGETKSYDPFLWVSQTPDTLKQTLCFDFNNDAQQHMSAPLQLGLFKKNADGTFIRIKDNEAELFSQGTKLADNIISVPSTCKELEVGIVFNPKAEDKTHYWYIRPIDNAGLERINDHPTDQFSSEEAIMEIRLKKQHVMNPLAKGILFFIIAFGVALLLWFIIFRPLLFPTFKVNYLELIGPEPYLNKLKIKHYRQLILTSKPAQQSFFNRLMTGEVKYSVNSIWTADVVFEPKDKRSIRIRPDKKEYITDARIMQTNTEYTLENLSTHSKTKLRIS